MILQHFFYCRSINILCNNVWIYLYFGALLAHSFIYFIIFFFNFGSYKSWTSELTLPVWTPHLPTHILLQLKDEARLPGSLCLIASSNCDFKQERVLFVTNQVILVGLDMMTCPQSLSVSLNSLQRVWSRTCLLSCSACSLTDLRVSALMANREQRRGHSHSCLCFCRHDNFQLC